MSNIDTVRVGGTDYAIEDPTKANASQIATIENGATSSAAYTGGEYIYRNGTLYVVTAAISAGGSFVVGTNIQATTVGDEVEAIKTDLSDKADKSTLATVESSSTASRAYAIGEYLVYNGILYEVTAAIASSGTITVGTNVAATNVGTELDDRMSYAVNGVLGAKNFIHPFVNTQTVYAVVYTFKSDGTIDVNGSPSGMPAGQTYSSINFIRRNTDNVTVPAGRYILSGCPSGGGANTYQITLQCTRNGTLYTYGIDYGDGLTVDILDGDVLQCGIVVQQGYTANHLLFKPMLRLASDPDDTYVPYAMTNRELTEVKDGAISYENGIGQQYATDVPLKKQGNVCMLSISLVGIVLSQGTWGSIGTLPEGFRPYKNAGGINVVKNASGNVFDCEAQAGGTLRIRNNSGSVASTDIVHFNGVYYAP